MKRQVQLLALTAALTITMASPAWALSQAEIDAQTGPTFGVSSTMTADGAQGVATQATVNDEEAEELERAEEAGVAVEHGSKGDYIGNFKATAYSVDEVGVGAMTASGKTPTIEHTIAADTSVLPMGTRIIIEGSDIVYTVEDTGVHGQTIDLFLSSHDACIQFGVKNVDIYYAK